MDFTNRTDTDSEQGDTPSENDPCPSSLSIDSNANSEVVSNSGANESAHSTPRGRVREMIKLYNSAANSVDTKQVWKAKPHPHDILPPDATPQSDLNIFEATECRVKRFGRQSNIEEPTCSLRTVENISQKTDAKQENADPSTEVFQGTYKAHKVSVDENSLSYSNNSGISSPRSPRMPVTDMEKFRSEMITLNSRDSNPTVNNEETSYSSQTTIAKTDEGVRIIIDIFFDQETSCPADFFGTRVLTEIPDSRILNEFKERAKERRREGDKRGSAN